MDSISPVGSSGSLYVPPAATTTASNPAAPAASPAGTVSLGGSNATPGTYSSPLSFSLPAGASVADQVAMATLSVQDQLASSLFGPPATSTTSSLFGPPAASTSAADPSASFFVNAGTLAVLNAGAGAALSYKAATPAPASAPSASSSVSASA